MYLDSVEAQVVGIAHLHESSQDIGSYLVRVMIQLLNIYIYI